MEQILKWPEVSLLALLRKSWSLGFVATVTACILGCFSESRVTSEELSPRQFYEQSDSIRVSAPSANAAILSGKVIAVRDGDTIDILDGERRTFRIRLHGIDAPESGQPFGRNVKQYVSDQISGQTIQVNCRGVDRYGRTIGDIILDGKRLNVELVRAGLAWHYLQYAPDDQELAEAEKAARETKIGLWSNGRHVAPWEWRKLSKEERDKLR